MLNVKKAIFVTIGCFALGLGTLGVVLPVLPTVPFFMLAAFAFAKSSQRLHRWFTGTALYKKNLESYVSGRGMHLAAKLRIMATVTLLMAVGFATMLLKGHYLPCVLLASVWVSHVLYFVLGVKTLKEDAA